MSSYSDNIINIEMEKLNKKHDKVMNILYRHIDDNDSNEDDLEAIDIDDIMALLAKSDISDK